MSGFYSKDCRDAREIEKWLVASMVQRENAKAAAQVRLRRVNGIVLCFVK
jgi:hypothetical protein